LHHKIEEENPLSAVDKKVLFTTNERKVMSRTTFFKRIALTAVTALGFGLLSGAPSQAVISAHTLTIGALSTDTTTSYASTIAVNETATATLKHTFIVTDAAQESVVVTATRLTAGTGTLRFTLSDSSTSRSATADPRYTATGADNAADLAFVAGSGLRTSENTALTTYVVSDTAATTTATALSTTVSLRLIAPSVAGTYTIVVGTATYSGNGVATDGVAGPSVTWTITVTAADVAATAASSSTLREGVKLLSDGTREGTDSSVTAARTAAVTTPAATIWVQQKNAASTANESMTVTVSGPAFVNTDSGTRPTAGTAITIRNLGPDGATYSYAGLTPIFVWPNGTAGTATITITTLAGLVLGTETVKFYGNVTSVVLDTTYRKILRAGGGSAGTGQATVDLYATDAAGMPVPGLGFSMVSSNTAAVSSVASSACTDVAGAPGYYECTADTTATSVSGNAATLTYRVVNPNITTSTAYYTVDHAVTLGGAVSTVTLTSDKATYDPGEKMTVTATATDSSGNPVSDGTAGPTGVVANKSLGGTLTMNAFYGGTSTSQVRSGLDPRNFVGGNEIYAPNASGKFTLTYTYGTDNAKVAVLTATVGDDASTAAANAASDAAAEAIDAANAATDAANLAAEAADAATVAAEEARDAADAATAAVEALATEVATLMAALKAQITTLANTVAKIAKKVKA
jgi:hypothetical protein